MTRGLIRKPLLQHQQTYILVTSGEAVGDSSLDVTVVKNMDEHYSTVGSGDGE